MPRQFRSDGVSLVLPNGRINQSIGACRPLTAREDVITDIVAEAMQRGNDNLERHFLEEALLEYETAIAVMPAFPHAHWNRGQVLMMLGRYDEGCAEFDWRFQLFGDTLAHKGIPIWCGEKLRGKRLLCWHEHGYGDTIMLLSYLPVLQDMGARLTLALPAPLRRLVRQNFDVEVLDELPKSFRRLDYRCPIFSLMPVMQQLGIPVPGTPYLAAEPAGRADVVGIAWSGSRDNSRDAQRSIPIDEFLSLLDGGGRGLHSVQLSELDDARARGVTVREYRDFAETAACLMAMKHVVTVCTATAHLAGAIGHPSVHVVVPHVAYWPWYRSDVWYPAAHVYRQPRPGDWASVFAQVNANLRSAQ